jgi:hypothetical protein
VAIGCVVLVSTCAFAVHAQPPSLAEIAERERARRATIAETSRVYTNDDLHRGPRLTTGRSLPETETVAERSEDGPGATTEIVDPEPTADGDRDESYWRDRIESARENLRRANLMGAALQNRVDGLWAEFTARDDPFQRAKIEQDRTEALGELEATQAEVERLEHEIGDIQEEARRASVPPGWLR